MVCLCSVYPYRIANLGLAVIEGLIDADDTPFTDDIERLSGRVHWRLCSRSLGGSSRGGGEEMDGKQCQRPRRQEWVVPPPHRSGNGSTETRRATPNHHYRRTDGGDLRCWVLPTSRSWSRILEHWCVELIKHGSVKKITSRKIEALRVHGTRVNIQLVWICTKTYIILQKK